MISLVPSYYKKFKCIAGDCRHSCCIGWEIDIDSKSLEKYKKHSGTLKQRFCESISMDEVPHFILDEKERCPFLNKDNLCDIYTEMGEGALCQICTDHPRFRNFYSDITEIGLGLCCEEACRIILEDTNKFTLECDSSDGTYEMTDEEQTFFVGRQNVIDILENRDLSFRQRTDALCEYLGVKFDFSDICKYFYKLEYMNDFIFDYIEDATKIRIPDIYLERLAVYFVFRHLSDYLYDDMYAERVIFSLVSTMVIGKMCVSEDIENVIECARMYSAEIEYSQENTDEILSRIGDAIEIQI